MKIIVYIKEVIDPALNIDFGLSAGVIFREGLPRRLNPPDAAALAMALDLKTNGAEITAVSIGEERAESYLRDALAIGTDRAVRIWDNELPEPSPFQKAQMLSGMAAISGADLVFTGSRSIDTANGQAGQMLAALLGWPCVSDVTAIEPDSGQKSVMLLKDIGRGEREKVRCSLPAVITIKSERRLPYAPLDSLIESKSKEITVLSPTDLGISPEALKRAPSCPTRLTFPRPRTVKAPPLDSSLPAFYRILQLLQGGISKRKGLMLEGDAASLAEQLYQLFLEEGALKRKE